MFVSASAGADQITNFTQYTFFSSLSALLVHLHQLDYPLQYSFNSFNI